MCMTLKYMIKSLARSVVMLGALGMCLLEAFSTPITRVIERPSDNFAFITRDGKEFAHGLVHICTQADTVLLKRLGFRELFVSSVNGKTAVYSALWPRTVDYKSLPESITGLFLSTRVDAAMNRSLPAISAYEADTQYPVNWQDGNQDRVILGIIDFGFDVQHQALRQSSGSNPTLFKGIWVMYGNDPNIGAPYPGDPAFGEGNFWTETDINNRLQGTIPVDLQDPNDHGTPCASTMVGRGESDYDGGLPGVNAGAPLLGVRIGTQPGIEINPSFFSRAVWLLRRKAADLGYDYVVISCSIAEKFGPHSGYSNLDHSVTTALETQPWSPMARPVMVVPVGNEAVVDADSYWHVRRPQNGVATAGLIITGATDQATNDYVKIELWYRCSSTTPSIWVEGPDGCYDDAEFHYAYGQGTDNGATRRGIHGPDGYVRIMHHDNNPATNPYHYLPAWDHYCLIEIEDYSGTTGVDPTPLTNNSTWTLHVDEVPGLVWDAYIVSTTNVAAHFTDFNNNPQTFDSRYVLLAPSSASGVIAVDGWVTKNHWCSPWGNGASCNPRQEFWPVGAPNEGAAYPFNSLGPLRSENDGGFPGSKPECRAPAMWICTAASGQGGYSGNEPLGHDWTHKHFQGTSMAAPHAAAAVAHCLALFGPFDGAGNARDLALSYLTLCQGTPPQINQLQMLLYGSDVDDHGPLLPDAFTVSTPAPNPFNSAMRMTIDLPHANELTVFVYDVLGRQVETLNLGHRGSGVHTFSWNGSVVSTGLYFFRVDSGKESKVVKALLLK